MTEAEGEKKSKAINLFAIIGFILLVLVAIWSTIQVVKFVPRLFGGEATNLSGILGGGADEPIVLTLSKDVVASGDVIEATWVVNTDTEGVVSFAYRCEEDFHFRIRNEDSSYTVLPCNEPYVLGGDVYSLALIPILDAGDERSVSLAITHTDANSESVRGLADLTVTNDGTDDTATADESNDEDADTDDTQAQDTTVPEVNTKGVVRYVTVPAAPQSNPNGTVDLQVRIIAIGGIDPYSGTLVPKGVLSVGENAGVKFEVTNLGDKASGTWTYNADLPTYPHYTYSSKAQPSLMPGSTATVVVSYNQLAATGGSSSITITVDPYNLVPESNEYNNTESRPFSVY